jgi:hypothetical protein
VLLDESKETVQGQKGYRATAIAAIGKPIHQKRWLKHMRHDVPVQSPKNPLHLYFVFEERQNGKPSGLDNLAMSP